MVTSVDYGYFRGRVFVQKQGNIGGYKSVFVKLKELHNELVYPTFGGIIMNPFKGRAKFFAGDLLEFRTNDNGVRPEVYILKTFKVVSASGTTVNVLRDGYLHKPFVGDVLMKAPDVIGGTGTAVTISAVTPTTVTVSEVTYDVYALTTSANIASSLSKDDILVEAEEAGDNKKMLVKNINAVADCDADMMYDEVANTANIGTEYEDFMDARYLYTPALGGLMYTHKMSPMPQCVLNLNRSNVNGWFKVNYYDMRSIPDTNFVNKAVASLTPIIAAADPTTSTVGAVGQLALGTTSGDLFMCTAIDTSGDTPSYTWTKLTA